MKRSLAASALIGAMTLAGCGEGEPATAPAAADAAVETAAPAAPAETAAPAPESPAPAAVPAAGGAPAGAGNDPGGGPDGPAPTAPGAGRATGIVQFTTDATPEAVIAFYREQAEAAGLKSINTMNRGASAGYSAGDGAGGRGQLLSVIATRVEGEPTSVQLDWTTGR